jgi:hypothetical protein
MHKKLKRTRHRKRKNNRSKRNQSRKSPQKEIETDPLAHWENAIKSILLEDPVEFRKIINAYPEIIEPTPTRGWSIIHYLYQYKWDDGIDIYLKHGGSKSILTADFLVKNSGSFPVFLVGGQTILHIFAQFNRDKESELLELIQENEELNIADFNGNTPLDLIKEKKDASTHKEQCRLVNTRLNKLIDISHVEPIDITVEQTIAEDKFAGGIKVFTIDKNLVDSLKHDVSECDDKIPNSMHRYGKVLLPKMTNQIQAIVKAVVDSSYHNSIKHIHSFYIKYNKDVQVNLDTHMDDSTFTLNICLNNNSTGSKLVFDDIDYTYEHASMRGIVHDGHINHHVTNILSGERENIIIWVTCI